MNVTVFLLFIAPEEWATTRSSLKAPPARSARGGYREHPYGRYWRSSSPVTSPQRQCIASGLHVNSNKTSNSPFFFSYSRDNSFMITPIYFLYFLYTVGVTLTLVLIFKTDWKRHWQAFSTNHSVGWYSLGCFSLLCVIFFLFFFLFLSFFFF